MKKLLLAAAALSAAFSSTHALGQRPAALSETVAYGDLDLTSAAGLRTLARRLERAVRQVCPGQDSAHFVISVSAHRCARETAAAVRGLAAVAIARAQGDTSGAQLAAR